jgi:hypothetical protein
MDLQLLKTVGQVAGIGGLAIGATLLIFRDIIRKNIFPKLASKQAFILLRLIVIASWTIGLFGIGAWSYVQVSKSAKIQGTQQSTSGPGSPAISGVQGGVTINYGSQPGK